MRINVSRSVTIPDLYKVELYKKAPELGPRILFFSGGTALRRTSRELIHYTHNSIHLITPFDSGGSSAVLRKAFGMPAVGDIRNRLMALADQSVKGNPEIFELFAHRLSKDLSQTELRGEVEAMAAGTHRLLQDIPDPMEKIICTHFNEFLSIMPPDFDLRGASMGNLLLTAGYLTNQRRLDPVIYIFSKLAQVCGTVCPTLNQDLHLAVRLENGTVIVGQHKITGKEVTPLTSPIKRIWLTDSLDSEQPVIADIRDKTKARIARADLICYPIGSFYSSVVANLLPMGVGAAVAANPCPKVFVPNTVPDPETQGMSIEEQIQVLRSYLHESGAPKQSDVLRYVVIDSKNANYPGGLDTKGIENQGVTIIDCPLICETEEGIIDGQRLVEILLSLT